MSNISDVKSSDILFQKNLPPKLQNKTKAKLVKNNEGSTNWTEAFENKNLLDQETPSVPLQKSRYSGPKFLVKSKSKHKMKINTLESIAKNKNNLLSLFP